jgi:hypothetical protein
MRFLFGVSQASEIPPLVVETPGALNFAVLGGGVRMPVQVAEVPPTVAPVEAAATLAPIPYVPPVRRPKKDLN